MMVIVASLLLFCNFILLFTDDDMFNITLKVSFSSIILSAITGTLTLLLVFILSNVAVSVVVSKSTPPVSQTLFSQHIIIHITLLPLADTGDCSDGVTVTLNGLLDVPPSTFNATFTNPIPSEPVYCDCVNLTLIVVESIITPVALVIEPVTTPGPSDDGTFKLILNVSSPSTILSFFIVILTILLLVPATILIVLSVKLKSVLSPMYQYKQKKLKLLLGS